MSMFKTEDCPVCGMPATAFAKSGMKYDGVYICTRCAKKLTDAGITVFNLKKHPLDELRKIVGDAQQLAQKHMDEVSAFHATKKVGDYIYFDDNGKKFAIPQMGRSGAVKDLQIYDYSDMLDYELLEDGNSVSKGGIGRAIVGGALFGGVGAIVGGSTGHKRKGTCSKLQVKITINSMDDPVIYLNFIVTETKKDGSVYKQQYALAQEALSALAIIAQSNAADAAAEGRGGISAADEILKFKQLLDSGIITQEEFDLKKKQLLGL